MKAFDILKNDGIVIHPTDTVYGLSGLYSSEIAYRKIFDLKKRPLSKPLGVLVGDISEFSIFSDISLEQLECFFSFLQRGMTLLLPVKKNLPSHLIDQSEFIGLRIPQHEQSRELIQECGPLICSSANLSYESPISSQDEAEKIFPGEFFMTGDAPPCGVSSTIILFDGTTYTLIREGNISIKEIKSHIKVSLNKEMV